MTGDFSVIVDPYIWKQIKNYDDYDWWRQTIGCYFVTRKQTIFKGISNMASRRVFKVADTFPQNNVWKNISELRNRNEENIRFVYEIIAEVES